MARGTEAFPDLGQHCEHEDCNQLDFLPFTCQSCQSVFCLRHRTREAHGCPKAEHGSRVVVVCDACALSIEKRAGEADAAALERHEKSDSCDPSKKRKKPKCPVNRCKEALSFSNTSTCKACNQKVCLKHRFPSDHDCNRRPLLLPARNGKACGGRQGSVSPPPPPPPTIKAC